MSALRGTLENEATLSRLGYDIVECDHGLLIQRRGHAMGVLQTGTGGFEFLLAGSTEPKFQEKRMELIVERIVQFVSGLTDNRD